MASVRMEVAAALWRARLKIIAVMLITVAAGLAASLLVTAPYTASAELLVLPSPDYAARVEAGATPASTIGSMDRDSFMKVETEILTSPAVARAVIQQIGVAALYPQLSPKPGMLHDLRAMAEHLLAPLQTYFSTGSAVQSLSPEEAALVLFSRDLTATPDKAANVIVVSFTNPNRAIAVETVEAVLQQDMTRRSQLFSDAQSSAVAEQAKLIGAKLDEATAAYTRFKQTNGIANYDMQHDFLLRRRDDSQRDKQNAESALAQAGLRLTTLAASLANTPAEIVLYHDNDLQGRVAKLKASLEDLRAREAGLQSRYGASGPALIEVRSQIATTVDQLARSQLDRQPTDVREGRNPQYDNLLRDQSLALQDQTAARARIAAADQQLAVQEQALTQLESNASALERLDMPRAALQQSYRTILATLQERQTQEGINAGRAQSIRPIKGADSLVQHSNLRLTVIIAGILASLVAAIMTGLLSYVFRRGFATADAVERACGLPVLATIPNLPTATALPTSIRNLLTRSGPMAAPAAE